MPKTQLYSYEDLQLLLLKSLSRRTSFITDVGQIVSTEDFSIPLYKIIFAYMVRESAEFSVVSMGEYLKSFPKETNGFDIKEFDKNPPMDTPVKLAKLVKQYSISNTAKQTIERALRVISDSNEPIEDISELNQSLNDLVVNSRTKEKWDISSSLDDFYHTITTKQDTTNRIKTRFPNLDKYTNGWGGDMLVTIAARTSIGKSVLAVNLAVDALKQDKKVLFFSLEMNEQQLFQRLVANLSDVRLNEIYPQINPQKQREIQEAIDKLRNMPLTIDTEPNVTIEYIKSTAESQAKDSGVDLIIVDYLQLITPPRNVSNREQQVAEISRAMKLLSKKLKVPVIVVAQLNREGKNDDENRLPSKADIRESGAIANDSDIILIVHRKYRDESSVPKGLIILDKNRDGKADVKVPVICALDKAAFIDAEVFDAEGTLAGVGENNTDNPDEVNISLDDFDFDD